MPALSARLARTIGTLAPSTMPAASAPERKVSCLASIFPASRSGTTRISARPATGETICFSAAAASLIALSKQNAAPICGKDFKTGQTFMKTVLAPAFKARLLGMHPQTLRKYERLGLVQPHRPLGSMRVYTRHELERLRLIKHLVDELGVNLAGVQRLLSIAEVVERMQPLARGRERDESRRQLERDLERLRAIVGF